MITQFRLENFKGHRDTKLALRQFTVLVGDNSSGKTSVLEALGLPAALAADPGAAALDDLLHRGAHRIGLSFSGTTRGRGHGWEASVALNAPGHNDWGATWALEVTGDSPEGPFEASVPVPNHPHDQRLPLRPLDERMPHDLAVQRDEALQRITRLTGHPRLYRFHSDQVAASAYSDQPDAAVAEDGALTAVALAALKLGDDEAFDRIETAMRRIVPSLQRVFVKPATLLHPSNPNPVTGSKLYFDFQGAKAVPAHHASQGTLVALALLTVLYGPHRPDVILLDDFDHALHPRAQIELVRMLKELLALEALQDTQIIATTHSPYVLDEVTPADVIAFALRDDGTVAAKPLSEHPDAPKVNGALKAGELWTLDAERDWVR